MKVVFVNPMIQLNGWNSYFAGQHIDRQRNSLPHGILSIAATLDKDIEVKVLDLRQMKGWVEFSTKLIEEMPDWLAVSSMSVDIWPALKSMEIAKNILPEVKTVIGGVHATQNPDDLEFREYIDYVFRHEAEVTFPKLLNGEIAPNGKVIDGELPDVDKIPYVDRTLVDYENGELNYGAFWCGLHPYVTMMAGRGCPFRCAFCSPVSRDVFRKVRFRSVDHLIGELIECKEKWKAAYFDFIDDTFTIKKSWVLEFCDSYEREGLSEIPFVGAARADIICNNEDMFKRLREIGCNTISVGFESGSDRILKLLKKGTTVEQNFKAAEILRKYNYNIVSNVIYGNPTETIEEAKATGDMLKVIQPEVNCYSFFTPYPGCELYEWCKEKDLILFNEKDFRNLHRYAMTPKIRGIDYNRLKYVMYDAHKALTGYSAQKLLKVRKN